MKKLNLKCILSSLALAGLSTATVNTAHATQYLNEPFNQYTDGTTLDSTANWSAFSGTTLPYTVTSGTVTATNLATGVSGEDDRTGFATTAQTTGILYFSTLVTPTFTAAPTANGDYFLSFYNQAATGGGYLARVFLSATTTGTSFGLSNSGTVPVDATVDVTSGTQYKLVLRLDLTAKTATLGIFAPGTAVTADSQLTIADTTAGTTATAGITSLALRQGSGTAFTNVIDGLQVGTTLADVSSINTAPVTYFNAQVPEPSTYALGVGGLLIVGFATRRNRQIA